VNSWRDEVLKEFVPQVARLTVVADPDGLLLEGGVLEGIRERGFELIQFEDDVAFRYAYESRFRSRWDRGEETGLVVVLRSSSSDLDTLPYDLLQAGRKLSFSLGDFFPNLSYPVVAALDRADLDALVAAQAKHVPGELGDNATKEFILRHVFEIAPELIREPHDLLRTLLRRHYRGRRIPDILDKRLIGVLRQSGLFDDWALEIIIPDRVAFFAFLQERWPAFLDSLAKPKGDAGGENASRYSFEYMGPALLPFDHDDVRIYIDDLFAEGLLRPVPHHHAAALAKTWVACGVRYSEAEDQRRRLENLLELLETELPTTGARHGEWLDFGWRWAELVSLALDQEASVPHACEERLRTLRSRIDRALTEWALRCYAGLINLPAMPPAMLHHIPRYLARILEEGRHAKIAYLVLDGLSLDQWITLRDELAEQDVELRFRESAIFAWMPTITPVSRQAAFAGKPPIYFPASIHTTDREQNLWRQFWVNEGRKDDEIAYAKGLGDGDLDRVAELLSLPKLRIVGLVVDKVDRIMHGMELGASGMHNQVRQWARQGYMRELLHLLHGKGFQVYLTSDHGNTEVKGVGRPAEGAVAEMRGERVRVYSDFRLRAQIKERFPDSLEWPTFGLPEDYLALIAPNGTAFVQKGRCLVSHGGISAEELLVPFVRVDESHQ